MIGVIANPTDHDVVSEFFELFKTPWEFYQNHRTYQAVLCMGDGDFRGSDARLVILYSARRLAFDSEYQIDTQTKHERLLAYGENQLPVYGETTTFPTESGILVATESGQTVIYSKESAGKVVVRVGYDLFTEVRTLLTDGQPATNAILPALELHIALLRDLLLTHRVSLIEIPPVPQGYSFIACLTHDIDHPAIGLHKFDHTMFGFLYRAVLGSIFDLLQGRMSLRQLLTNWTAACGLPLVYLRLAKDFWSQFARYTELEEGARSTFFVIPFKGRAGRSHSGPAPHMRSAAYSAVDITAQIQTLVSAGCEIGVHGIDAWLDSSSGYEELEEVCRISGQSRTGVRMHWLYFDEKSPSVLERAGADYDSTCGYNETVGYRAGTTQVYKPLSAKQLMELPLHIMDTALFYPRYLNLSKTTAQECVGRIIANAIQFGGVVTVNWHDRSIAPERLWGEFYTELVAQLKNRGAWFATGAQTVAWFRKRRSAVFENVGREGKALQINIASDCNADLPDLQLRVHNRPESSLATAISVQ
jgi:hypothetical protein